MQNGSPHISSVLSPESTQCMQLLFHVNQARRGFSMHVPLCMYRSCTWKILVVLNSPEMATACSRCASQWQLLPLSRVGRLWLHIWIGQLLSMEGKKQLPNTTFHRPLSKDSTKEYNKELKKLPIGVYVSIFLDTSQESWLGLFCFSFKQNGNVALFRFISVMLSKYT